LSDEGIRAILKDKAGRERVSALLQEEQLAMRIQPVFAKSLSLLSILLVLPLGLLLIGWFLSQTGIGFLSFFDHLPTPNATFREWWLIYLFAGPLLSLVLLIWSSLLKQEGGTSALSSEWKLVMFLIVSFCVFVIAYGFILHALAG
jgi:hypothetical protein